MYKTIALIIAFTLSSANAAQWVTLGPQDLLQVEAVQDGVLSFANEGVYFKHKSTFTTSLSCAKKQFVVITDEVIADRALSMAMFAMASNKTMRFYVTGCDNGYLHGQFAMLVN